MKKLLIIICVIFLSVFAFFFSNIKGYYRFKQYCEAEGGLRVYEPLERNVGWLADDKSEAMAAAQLQDVAYVRYYDNSQRAFDVRYKGGFFLNQSSYEIYPSNMDALPTYHWVNNSVELKSEHRLHLYGKEVYGLKDKKMVARYYIYGYEVFNRSKTILDMPSEEVCHSGFQGSAVADGALSIKKLRESFKN